MYKNVLQSIDNIAIWPIVSFIIFFLFFIFLLWWVFTTDKDTINYIKQIPNEDGTVAEKLSSPSSISQPRKPVI